MAASRSEQEHQRRVDAIAEETAAKVAADAPANEEVVVTIEERPPSGNDAGGDAARAPAALPSFLPWNAHQLDSVSVFGAAGVEFAQRVLGAQIRFWREATTIVASTFVPERG